MARQVDVEFRFLDNFTSSFRQVMGTLSSGTAASIRAWNNVEKMGKGISDLGAKITTGVTLPIVGLGAASFKSFGEVDKTLKLVGKTMGSTSEEAKMLEGAIKTAASNSTFGMQDAADASLNFARQGFNAAQAADMISPAMNLAAGTASDLTMVTGGLGNTLKAFGADANEATHYADMMAKAQAQANTNVEGLFDTMSIAGSMAKTVGWSFSDLATITGVYGDAGVTASVGATAIVSGLQRLSKHEAEATGVMKDLGINIYDANEKMKSMPEVIGELQKGFEGLTDLEQINAAQSIFGVNQAGKWLTLIKGPGMEALQGYKDSIEGATGASKEMADALMSGPGGAMEQLKSTFDVFKYSAGSAIADAIVPFINKITDLMDKFNHMSPEQQKQIAKWAMMAATVGPTILLFGKTVSIIGKVGGAFAKLGRFASIATRGFRGLSAGGSILRTAIAAIASPAGIVIAAIAGIAVVVIAIITHFNTFKAALNTTSPTMQKLKANFEAIKAKIMPLIPIIQKVGAVVMDVLGHGIAAAAGIAISAFAGLINGIIDYVKGIMQTFKGLITFIKGVFTGDWKMAWQGIKDFFAGIVKMIMAPLNTLKSAIGGVIDGAKGLASFVTGGGKSSAASVPAKATGDLNWMGGLVQVSEKGGEIIDLPHGSRIYPHDESVRMGKAGGSTNISIPKLADQIIVREEADIHKIGRAVAREIMAARRNRGGMSFSANMV